jgi:hypothetical protein
VGCVFEEEVSRDDRGGGGVGVGCSMSSMMEAWGLPWSIKEHLLFLIVANPTFASHPNLRCGKD